MSRIHLTVKAYAGTDITYCIVEMIQLADRLGVEVHGEMNGVTVMAKPGDDPQLLHWAWDEALKDKRPSPKFAVAMTRGEGG